MAGSDLVICPDSKSPEARECTEESMKRRQVTPTTESRHKFHEQLYRFLSRMTMTKEMMLVTRCSKSYSWDDGDG